MLYLKLKKLNNDTETSIFGDWDQLKKMYPDLAKDMEIQGDELVEQCISWHPLQIAEMWDFIGKNGFIPVSETFFYKP